MNFNYRNYVTRYNYQPYCWPPDLSLAELHARCSQPGPINQNGIKCPCCQNWSKKKVHKWWKHNIDQDLKNSGAAIPGYFQLLKYYSCFALLVLLINSIYPIYATFYACQNLDPRQQVCLSVGILYFLEFNALIDLLKYYGKQDMIDILLILETTVFYVLLAANYFSVMYITFHNNSAKRQFETQKDSQANRCLVFYNIDKLAAKNIHTLLKEEQNVNNMNIIKKLDLYQVKSYYENFIKRNRVYYHLLSLYVIAENPLKIKKLNEQLKNYHQIVLEQKQKINRFNNKILVMFEDVETCQKVNKLYKISLLQKWYYGFRTLLDQFNIKKFDDQSIKLSTYTIGFGSDVIWQNLGEKLGVKIAIRIKTFFVATLFIIVCYAILYYPMMLSLKVHIQQQSKRFVHLSTFQKILPNITAFALVGLSIYFRVYMEKLSEQRNPKDQLQKAKFLLVTCVTFHILFYIVIPTLFFVFPSQISQTVKLFVISQQARTYVVIQAIMVVVDLPFTLWSNKKIKSLSDQRIAFKNNQWMLNKIVQCRDYPLEGRLQVLFRIWSLVLFYAFFIPYIIFYIVVAFLIIFWIQKRNLYKHYAIKRKISIKLQSQTLMYYVNFFCLYLCFIYCYSVRANITKIVIAIIVTLVGLITNILYWIVLNKGEAKTGEIVLNKNSQSLSKEQHLIKKQKLQEAAQKFSQSYKNFLKIIQNQQLDIEITQYLKKFSDFQAQRKSQRMSQRINQQIQLSQMQKQDIQEPTQSQNQLQDQVQNVNSDEDFNS